MPSVGPEVDEVRLRARRLRAQLLSGPQAATPEDVVGRLVAVQAQDERGFRLALRPGPARDRSAAAQDRKSASTSAQRSALMPDGA